MSYIFLHGLGQTPASWEKTMHHLAQSTDIFCPSLPELINGREITYKNLYQGFSEFCKKFSDDIHLCGLSLGGILALQYGIENPEKVKSLVLIGTQYVMPKGLLTVQNAIFRFMPSSMFQEMGFQKEDFIKLSKSMMELDFSHNLKKISCPVLVVCGEKDSANRKASKGLMKLLPNAEIQIIKDAKHEVNEDASERLGAVLNKFYSGR
ncbi:MAG: alpha/beta fold hydrolase [Lachnospiraceae bacterium]|nr:alpha/beta fold hydrolase [Lachnospiraceae bacterium]